MKSKRVIAFLLAVVLVIGTVPLRTSAATTLSSTPYAKVEYSYSTGVTAGTIRFIQQMPSGSYYYSAYWPSGSFGGYSGSSRECGTASISMALSYIGINKTPKEILEKNNGYTVFDGNWGASYSTPSVATGMDNYINGNGKYSPVIIHLPNYSYSGHYVILAGRVSGNVYMVVDPAKATTWNITINGTSASYNSKTDTIDRIIQYYNPNGQIAVPCTVTFHANGGTCATSSTSVNAGNAVGTLPVPTFEDMAFTGWYTAPYGGTQVTASTVISDNTDLYAHYGYTDTSINFDANGGNLPQAMLSASIDGVNIGRPGESLVVFNNNVSSPNTNTYGAEIAVDAWGNIVATRQYGDETQLTIPDGGFVLSGQAGWDSENSCQTGGILFLNSIFAQDTASLYVSLDYETGEVRVFDDYTGYLADIKRGSEGTILGALPVPTREGYLFDGWYAMGSAPVSYHSEFAGSELTAGWDSEDALTPVASTIYNDHLYEVYDYNVSWTGAKALCESFGGHLVTITDAGEQAAVTALTAEGRHGSYRIGATDEAAEGVWTWVTGEEFSYSNWDPDYLEPDGGADESYAALIAIENAPNKQVGEWIDGSNVPLGNHFYDISNTGFICEYETSCRHSYESAVIDATCTEPGSTVHTCTKCGSSYATDTTEPLGHDYASGVCTRCGAADPEYDPSVATGWSGNTTWTLTDDGTLTFSGSGSMKNYTYKSEMPWYSYRDQITSVVLEDGVTSIGDYAFYGMPTLRSVSIPETVTAIGDYAFKNAEALEDVALPGGLTSLGESAFYACTSLTGIDIPASLWTIKPYTFKNCTALVNLTLHEGNLQKISDSAFYNTALKEVTFPDCLDIIDVYSFKNCSGLSSVTLGSGINQIREAVFYGTSISQITIPEGVTVIKPYAFKNCVNLVSVELPESLTNVDEAAFYACTALETVDLPDAITGIGSYAFRKCTALTAVSFGSGLEEIGECAFYGCESLSALELPASVATIRGYAFKSCTALEHVTLSEGLTVLGDSAFHTCTGLAGIVIPAHVAQIGEYCFSGSTGLQSITFEGDAPSIGSGALNRVTATAWYPGGNATWTDTVRQNYGGTITWMAQ